MSAPKLRPARIELFPNAEVGILWEDGREDFLPARELRLACPCAECMDENSGRRTLRPETVPGGVRALSFAPVGAYGVRFAWSDGHDVGIYSFTLLRRLAE